MPPKSIGLVQGTLDMLILKTLALEPMHGYGIGVRIEQISKSAFQVNAGSLIPALNRLERAGYLAKEWRSTDNNRRAKYYKLIELGRKRLKAETQEWENQTAAIARILKARWGEICCLSLNQSSTDCAVSFIANRSRANLTTRSIPISRSRQRRK